MDFFLSLHRLPHQDIVYKSSLPVYRFLRALGVFPYTRNEPGQAEFNLLSKTMGYSIIIFLLLLVCQNLIKHTTKYRDRTCVCVCLQIDPRLSDVCFLSSLHLSDFFFFGIIQSYVIYVGINRIKIVQSLEGRFEESVIAYLFLVNILPILIVPMIWTETSKFTKVLNDWTDFEV